MRAWFRPHRRRKPRSATKAAPASRPGRAVAPSREGAGDDLGPDTRHGPGDRSVVGIGAEYVRQPAEHGWDLALVTRRAERLTALADRLREQTGAAGETLVADLARPADLARVESRAAAADVTLLVNTAGINGYGPFAEVDAALLTKVLHG